MVLDLAKNMEGKGHVISMNNFFTSVGLFKELALKKSYANASKLGWNTSCIQKCKSFKCMLHGTLQSLEGSPRHIDTT